MLAVCKPFLPQPLHPGEQRQNYDGRTPKLEKGEYSVTREQAAFVVVSTTSSMPVSQLVQSFLRMPATPKRVGKRPFNHCTRESNCTEQSVWVGSLRDSTDLTVF